MRAKISSSSYSQLITTLPFYISDQALAKEQIDAFLQSLGIAVDNENAEQAQFPNLRLLNVYQVEILRRIHMLYGRILNNKLVGCYSIAREGTIYSAARAQELIMSLSEFGIVEVNENNQFIVKTYNESPSPSAATTEEESDASSPKVKRTAEEAELSDECPKVRLLEVGDEGLRREFAEVKGEVQELKSSLYHLIPIFNGNWTKMADAIHKRTSELVSLRIQNGLLRRTVENLKKQLLSSSDAQSKEFKELQSSVAEISKSQVTTETIFKSLGLRSVDSDRQQPVEISAPLPFTMPLLDGGRLTIPDLANTASDKDLGLEESSILESADIYLASL